MDGKTASPSEIGPREGSEAAATAPVARRRSHLKWVDVTTRLKQKRRGSVEGRSVESDTGRQSSPSGSGGAGGGCLDEAHDHQLDVGIEETSSANIPASGQQHPFAESLRPPRPILDLAVVPPPEAGGCLAMLEDSEVTDIARDDWLDGSMVPSCPAIMLNLRPLLSNPDPRMRLLFHHCKRCRSFQDRPNCHTDACHSFHIRFPSHVDV